MLIQAKATRTTTSPKLPLRFLASVPHHLTSCLSNDAVEVCFEQWTASLRSQDHVEAMTCLKIAHEMNTTIKNKGRPETSCPGSSTTSKSLPLWIERCRNLFTASKVSSIIERIVLMALKWCSETIENESAVVGAMNMAYSVLRSIDLLVVKQWTRKYAAVVRKLSDKARQPDLASILQSQALKLLTVLDATCEYVDWPLLIKSTLPNYLANTSTCWKAVDADLGQLAHSQTFALTQGHLWSNAKDQHQHQDILHCLTEFILKQCLPDSNVSVAKYCQLQLARSLIAVIESHNPERIDELKFFADGLCKRGIPQLWSLDLCISTDFHNCASNQVCRVHFELTRQQLCLSVTLIGLRYASASSNNLDDEFFERLSARLSLSNQTRVPSCRFPEPFQSKASPSAPNLTSVTSVNWREQLQSCLSSRSEEVGSIVGNLVAELCSDLQKRCDDVETPLRRLDAKLQQVEEHLKDAKQEVAASQSHQTLLQNALNEKEGELRMMKAEVEQLQHQLSASDHNYQKSLKDVHEAREIADRLSSEFQNRITRIEADRLQELNSVKGNHANECSHLQAQMIVQEQQIAATESRVSWIKDNAEQTTHELRVKQEQILAELHEQHAELEADSRLQFQQLQTELSGKTAELDHANDELQFRQLKVEHLTEQESRHKEQLESLQSDLSSTTAETQRLGAELREEKQKREKLFQDQAAQQAELDRLVAQIEDVEHSEAALRQQCKTQEKALKKAKRAEANVLAILQNARQPGSSPTRMSATPLQNTATPSLRLPQDTHTSEEEGD